jgi:RNA polymerase sigma-70 factor (ECF subfamily)
VTSGRSRQGDARVSEGCGQEGEMVVEAENAGRQSLGRLFESCYPKVYRYMYVRVRHQELAEDLTSDVMLRVVRSLRFYHYRGVPIEAWVYRIAANRLRDHFRKDHASRTVSLNEALVRAGRDGLAERVATWHDLRMAFSHLSRVGQQVLALRYVQGLNIEETAQVMGRSRQSIKNLSHRTVARLRGLLADETPPLPARVAEGPELRGQGTKADGASAATHSQEDGR